MIVLKRPPGSVEAGSSHRRLLVGVDDLPDPDLILVHLTVVGVFVLDGRDVADRRVETDVVDHHTQFKVASSTSSTPRQGPSWWMHSVLYSPMVLSPRLLS